MAIVASVELVTISGVALGNEPVSQDMTKGQDWSKCVPFSSHISLGQKGGAIRDLSGQVEIYDNGGTAAVRINASDMQDTDGIDYKVFIVEFDSSINVNQYTANITDTNSTANITITDVTDQSSAFFIYSAEFTGTATGWQQWQVATKFNGSSTTSVTISKFGTAQDVSGILYVVDCDSVEFTVEHAEIILSASAAESATDTIATTVMADTFLIHSFLTAENNPQARDQAWWADLQNTTTVRVRRSIADDAEARDSTHNIMVVECQNSEWGVQRNDALTIASISQTDSITAIDQTRSIINLQTGPRIPCGRSSSTTAGDISDVMVAADFSANDTVRFQCEVATITNSVISYEVIQFALASANINSVTLKSVIAATDGSPIQ